MPVGLWNISDEGPQTLKRSSVGLEKNLESWIERDPDMLQSGMTIVGRQIKIEAGRLDLLGLDMQGGWILIEIKSGYVYRETIAQVLDYAACLSSISYQELSEKVNEYLIEEGSNDKDPLRGLLADRQVEHSVDEDTREVQILVVGTGRAPGLQRMVNYLTEAYEMPVAVVTFEVFEDKTGQRIMVRELAESELSPPKTLTRPPSVTIEAVLDLAKQNGFGEEFDLCLDAAKRHGLYPHPWKTSIMFAPPSDRRMCLYTIWTTSRTDDLLKAWIGPKGFSNYFPVAEDEAENILGSEGYRDMNNAEVKSFVDALDHLFEEINKNNPDPELNG